MEKDFIRKDELVQTDPIFWLSSLLQAELQFQLFFLIIWYNLEVGERDFNTDF